MRLIFNYRITLFVSAISLFSCHHTSEVEHPLSKPTAWNAHDSLAFYFPQSKSADLGFKYSRSDTFRENWYSSALFSFREPVLYNNYNEGGTYRFLWLRSFNPPVVFVLSRSSNQVTLMTKILDHQPEFMETRYSAKGWDGLMDELKGKTIKRFGDSLVVVVADRKATIVFNQTKRLSEREWIGFEELLRKARFSTGAANYDDSGMDGSEWVIERLMKDRYRFVVRWSPTDAFRDAGVYLIKLSGIKEKIY